MHKTACSIGFGVLIGALWINCVMAAPIAPKAPVTKLGKYGVIRATGPCPAEKEVGVPAYPGSVCLKSGAFNSTMAFVELMSSDNAKKITDWYAKHLNGWVRVKAVTGDIVFTPPGERTNAANAYFSEIHVSVTKLKKSESKLKKSFFVFKGTPASIISIGYVIHGAQK